MAYHIWNEYWPAIIGQAQTDYMVEKFQSLNAFRTDIADNGYEYFFIMQHEDETPHELGAATHGADIHDQGDTVAGRVNDDVESDRDDELAHDTEDFARTAAVPRIVGYTGGHVEADTNRFFISKIYLLKEHRGEGLCSATIRFYERLARERGPRCPLPHGEQAQRDGHPRLQGQGLRGHRRRGNRHRRRLHHGRLHHGEEAAVAGPASQPP